MSLEDFNIHYINDWILIPAAAIILFLSYLEKRSYRPDVCGGRPALIIPLPFLDGYENRLAYCVAFGTITNTFVSLVTSEKTLNFSIPLWGQALYVYLQAFIGCLTCFPFFACLSTRFRAVGAGVCIVYSAVWLSLSVVNTIKEANESANETVWDMSLSDDVMTRLGIAKALLLNLPSVSSYILLIGYCIYILYRCVKNDSYYNKHYGATVRPHQEEHVRWVLRKSKKSPECEDSASGQNTPFIQRMYTDWKLRLFRNLPFFKYPTKIMAMAFLQISVIYWVGSLLIFSTIKIVYELFQLLKQYVGDKDIDDHVIIISVCGAFALLVAIANSIIHIFVAIRNYRYHLLKIYQGEKEFAVKFQDSSQYLLTSSMIYPGYQMSFMVWGCVIGFNFVFLLVLAFAEMIYFLAQADALVDIVLDILQLLSFPATMLILFYLQMFLSKKVLLQDKLHASDEHPPLNINNRKLFELVNYYSLFTNMAIGIFTCLMRIILSALFGVFAVGRLDKSVFTNDLETFDKGYRSYLSMLLVDNAHNNPSMRVFAHLLWTRTLSRRHRRNNQTGSFDDKSPLTSSPLSRRSSKYNSSKGTPLDSPSKNDDPWTFCDTVEEFRISSRNRFRWFLIYTLINNPQLKKLRKHQLVKTLKSDPQTLTNSIVKVEVEEEVVIEANEEKISE